jgi:hypothetical protein
MSFADLVAAPKVSSGTPNASPLPAVGGWSSLVANPTQSAADAKAASPAVGGWSSLIANPTQSARFTQENGYKQSAADAKAASDKANSFLGLGEQTLKDTGNTLLNDVGGLAGISPDEIRDPTFLENAAEAVPSAIAKVATQAVEYPIKTAQDVVGGAARGISDSLTGIITNLFVPKNMQAATSAQVKQTLDKYLGESDPTDPIQQGYEQAGQAAPYIAAGGVGGELAGTAGGLIGGLSDTAGDAEGAAASEAAGPTGAEIGSKIGGAVGNIGGFVGLGQATIPTDSTLQERATKATNDLVGLGLFELGSKAFDFAKSHIFQGLKAAATAGAAEPAAEPTAGAAEPAAEPTAGAAEPAAEPTAGAPAEPVAPVSATQTPNPDGVQTPVPKVPVPETLAHLDPTGETQAPKAPVPETLAHLDPTGETQAPKAGFAEQTPTPDKFKVSDDGSKVLPTDSRAASTDKLVDVRSTKSASDINQKFVDAGIDKIPDNELQKYNPGSYKADAVRVKDLMDTDIQKAKDMVTGKIPVDDSIKYPEILHNAMEQYASSDPTPENIQLLKDMATDGISKTSEAGATLGSHGFNDNPNSPVDAIREVTQAREDSYEKKNKEPVAKAKSRIKAQASADIDKEVSANASKRPTWGSFIKEVQCGY